MEKLRIALTHVYAWPEVRRGGERYLHELAAALRKAGHDVLIMSTAPRAGRDRVLDVDVRYLRRRSRLQLKNWFGDSGHEVVFGVQAWFRLALKRLDVWHALGTGDAAAAASLGRVRSIRSVYTDLGIPEIPYRTRRSDWRLHRFVAKRIDRYVCLSEAAGAPLRRDFGREPIVIGAGVDLDAFRPAERRNPTPALLFTSDASEMRKNLPLLLEAVGILRRNHPTVELWLAGPGDPSPALDAGPRAAKDAAVATGVGSFDELVDLYGRAWVTVLPSFNEAFGLVLLESLACGTPIVALSGGAPAEFVTPRTGATSPQDPAQLAAALERALELARDPGTAEACRASAEPHDWHRGIVPRMEAVYRDGALP